MAQELTFNISEDRRKLQGPVETKNFNLKFGTDDVAITHGNPKQWVQGRIGDNKLKQVFVNVTEGENNTPKDVAGLFLAFVGIIHDKDGRPHRVVDYKHSTTIDVKHGRFRFDFPDQAFTVAGEYQQAFFMLVKEGPGGGCVATMEFDMQVMANFVFTDLVPEDYITPFNDTVDQLLAACKKFKDDTAADEAKFKQELEDAYAKFQKDTNTQFNNFKDATDDDLAKFKKANADDIAKFKQQYADAVKAKEDELQNKVDSYTDKLDTLLKDLNQQGIDTTTLLTTLQANIKALEDKIKQDGLFTQAEADAFKQEVLKELNQLKLHIYDTVADMREADLKKGQTARTLGEYKLNDGGGATYKITDSPSGYNVDLNNGLKAEKIDAGLNNYYNDSEITVNNKRINNTDVYFVNIAKTDEHGQPIIPHIAQNASDRIYDSDNKAFRWSPSPIGKDLTPTQYAQAKHTSLTVNGSASVLVANNTYINGNIIGDGKILNTWNAPEGVKVPENFVYVAIMKDRSLRQYPFSTSAQKMIDDGVQDSWLSYWRLINNGNLVDNSQSKGNEGHTKVSDLNPHLGLGIKDDGTLVIAACDGRTDINPGLTSDDFAQAMKDWGCINAWHMDGGGSTSVTHNGLKINRNIDNDGVTDRAIPYTFNVKKPGAGGGTAEAYSQVGKAQQEILRKVMPNIHHLDTHTSKWFGQYSFKNDNELEQWMMNDLPNLINWLDYPSGATISGVIATQYTNSTPALQLGIKRNVDWYFTYFESGSHKYGTLTMYPNGYNGKVTRYYQQELNPQWTGWYGEGVAHSLHPAIIDPMVKELHACQGNSVVQIDCKLVVPTNLSWEDLVKPLPKSVGPAGSKASQFIGYNGKLAKAIVNQDGILQVRAEPDTYDIHYVYLTNIVD